MNKFLLCFVCLFSYNCFAGLTLNGTRFIYNEGVKSIEIQVINNESKTYGGQVWIENLKDSGSFFTAYPSLFKVEANKHQNVRIINANDNLPKDRESVSYINVQEIPPKSDVPNALALAMNIKVKLLYRPKNLKMKRDRAEQNILISRDNSGFITLKNNTPYYFALINFSNLPLTGDLYNELGTFKPFGEVKVPVGSDFNEKIIKFKSINDYGGADSYELPIKNN